MTPEPLEETYPAPRSDPPHDVEVVLRIIEAYDAADWPTAANQLARCYRALAADWATEQDHAILGIERMETAERELAQLREWVESWKPEMARLQAMDARADDVVSRRRFPSWIGMRIGYWIKNGTGGIWPYT